MNEFSPDDFISIAEVKRITHRSSPTIYRGIAAKTFPAPVKFGPQTSLWIRTEIMAWIAGRIAARDEVSA